MKNLVIILSFLLIISCDKDCVNLTHKTEIVKKQLNNFSTGDIPSFLEGCSTDCIFDLTGNQLLNPGKIYIGTQGFMNFLADLSIKAQPTLISSNEFYESEAGVTVTGEVQFTDLLSAQKCSVMFIQFWKFSGDKLIYFKEDHDIRICQ